MRSRLTRPIAEIHSPRRVQEARPRVLCALRNVRRVPSHAGANPRAAGPPVHFGGVVPDSQHCHHPKGSLAHTPHSSHWGCARGLALGVLCYHCAAAPSALPRGHRVRNASPGQIHTSDMAGNSPVYSHGCKSPLPIAEWVAGNSGCSSTGRFIYISYSSTPLLHPDMTGAPPPCPPFDDSSLLRISTRMPDHVNKPLSA